MFHDKHLLYVNKSLIQSRMHECQVTNTYNRMHQEEESLYGWMLESISEKDFSEAGIAPYLFWGVALTRMKRGGFQKAFGIALQRLIKLKEPVYGEDRRREFCKYLEGISDKGIYLYCAGSRGKALIMALHLRDIHIQGISDTDSSKWGMDICGVSCIPPTKIPKDALVIVTKASPNDVMDMLEKRGYMHVICYDALINWFLETPISSNAISVLNHEISK